jgi:hypothetical protein
MGTCWPIANDAIAVLSATKHKRAVAKLGELLSQLGRTANSTQPCAGRRRSGTHRCEQRTTPRRRDLEKQVLKSDHATRHPRRSTAAIRSKANAPSRPRPLPAARGACVECSRRAAHRRPEPQLASDTWDGIRRDRLVVRSTLTDGNILSERTRRRERRITRSAHRK